MASVTIVFAGPPEQRHVLKVSPMGRLLDALIDACGKFKPALDPSACVLTLGSKPVELDTPFRMLNLPANPRLEVQKVNAPPPAASGSAPPPVAAGAAGSTEQQQQQQQQQQQEHDAGAGPSSQQQAAAGATASTQQQEQQGQPGQQGSQQTDDALRALGITVPLHVFNQAAVEAAAAAETAAEAASIGQASSSGAAEEDDSFFDFTPEDWARTQRAAKEREKYESQFRSKGLREAEERARAEAFGLVPVRLHFPDRSIIQASFPATEPVASLQALVGNCLAPQLLHTPAPSKPTSSRAAGGAKGASTPSRGYYLYTAPPKTVLKDGDVALWQAGLLPAAHVYVALDANNPAAKDFTGPYLAPELMARMQDTVPQSQQPPQQAAPAGAAAGEAMDADVAAVKRAHAASGAAGKGQGAKLPKWFKGK